jgi:hypothetical protein
MRIEYHPAIEAELAEIRDFYNERSAQQVADVNCSTALQSRSKITTLSQRSAVGFAAVVPAGLPAFFAAFGWGVGDAS